MSGNGKEPHEWPWWLASLNEAVGPIVAGRLIVIGARPSCGKSAFAMNLFWHLGRALAQSVPYREEDPRPLILSCWTERARPAALVSLTALVEGLDEDLALREVWDQLPHDAERRLTERVRVLSGEDHEHPGFPILDLAVPTADEIAAALDQYRPHAFLLDYLQKVRPVRGQTTFDAWLAAMAHCACYAAAGNTVIVTSQLKRKGDGVFDKYRPPFMEDFKGGGAIEEAANVALGLFRPLKPMTARDEREVRSGRVGLDAWQQPGVMAIKVLKHTFWGPAADRLVRVRIAPNRRISDHSEAEVRSWSADDDATLAERAGLREGW